MRWSRRATLLAMAGFLVSCTSLTGDDDPSPLTPPPPPQPPAPAPVYRIAGPPYGLLLGGQFPLALLDQKDQAVEATWMVADTLQGSVTDTGLLQACWGVPSIVVSASPRALPTIVVTASYAVIYRGHAEASIRSILRADGGAVDLQHVDGDVDLVMAAGPLPCRDIGSLRLELVNPASNTIIGIIKAVEFSPARHEVADHQFRWQTTAVPNGHYLVQPVASIVGFTPRVGLPIPIQISNP